MKLNYFQSLTDFFLIAPDLPGYKPVYAASFSGIINLLAEAQRRSITLKYAHLNGLLKISEEYYHESLKWLDEAGLIVYFKGRGRNAPATVLVNVPEFPESVVTESQNQHTGIPGGIGGSNGVGTGVSTQGGKGGSSQAGGANSPFSPPPYPPIEVNNIIPDQTKQTAQEVGQAVGPVSTTFQKPKNISLSPDEESSLLLTFGLEKVRRMLLLVSVYKLEQGGTLKASDFSNCVKWASMKVDAQDEQARREALGNPNAPSRPTYGMPAPVTHVTSTHKPFRELT